MKSIILILLGFPVQHQQRVSGLPEQGHVIAVTVKHNGLLKTAKGEISFASRDGNVTVRFRKGQFVVPVNMQSGKVSLSAKRVKIQTTVSATELTARSWHFVLEDKAFAPDFTWVIPKEAIVQRVCVLVSEFATGNSIGRFDLNCRVR